MIPGSRWRAPGMTEDREAHLLLLRLPLFHRAAGVTPGGEAAAHVRDRLQAHVLRGLGRERRAQAAGAVEDELLVFLEDRLGVGALPDRSRIPACRGCRRTRRGSCRRVRSRGDRGYRRSRRRGLRRLDGVSRADGLDRGVGLVDQGFDAAGGWSGALNSPLVRSCTVIPGWSEGPDPELHILDVQLHI